MVEHGLAGHDAFVLLGVVARGDVESEGDLPAVGGGLAGEYSQQARLAGAVEPQHQQPLAALDGEADVLEHRRSSVGLSQVLDLEGDATSPWRGGEAHVPLALAPDGPD